MSLIKKDQEKIQELEARFQTFKDQFDRGLAIQSSMTLISLVENLGKLMPFNPSTFLPNLTSLFRIYPGELFTS